MSHTARLVLGPYFISYSLLPRPVTCVFIFNKRDTVMPDWPIFVLVNLHNILLAIESIIFLYQESPCPCLCTRNFQIFRWSPLSPCPMLKMCVRWTSGQVSPPKLILNSGFKVSGSNASSSTEVSSTTNLRRRSHLCRLAINEPVSTGLVALFAFVNPFTNRRHQRSRGSTTTTTSMHSTFDVECHPSDNLLQSLNHLQNASKVYSTSTSSFRSTNRDTVPIVNTSHIDDDASLY